MSQARALVLAGQLMAMGCGASLHSPQAREARAALRVTVDPDYAKVEVDEQGVGSARVLSQLPVRLTTGPKRISITAPGYFPHDMEVNLGAGETRIDVRLRKVPP